VLQGKRVLIVEDEPLIALDLGTAITDNHGTIVGPCGTVAEAQRACDLGEFDAAIVDLRLRGELSVPIAEHLVANQIPMVIYSGQSDITGARAWPQVPVISKPALPEQVIALLAQLIQAAPPADPQPDA
jgi:DNA-binding NtrC family response regulator